VFNLLIEDNRKESSWSVKEKQGECILNKITNS